MSYAIKINTQYKSDITGKTLLLPAIFTENGILISHLRYLSKNSHKSQSWREQNIFSVSLLIKYINANHTNFTKTTDLLRSFTDALNEGTINIVTSEDPSGLFWPPRKIDYSNTILSHITSYTDYLTKQPGYENNRINPFQKSNSTEARLNWCAYYHKHANTFLNHLSDHSEAYKKFCFIREIHRRTSPVIDIENISRFPEHEIDNLLTKGFVRSNTNAKTPDHERYDYKNQAITLLMHYGGLRKSEALHLYINDIIYDTKRKEAIVRVHHPSNGNSPNPEYNTRKEFLAKIYKILPRNEYPISKRLFCGWKSPLLTDKRGFFQVIFCPSDKAVEFLNTWVNYLKYQRVSPAKDNNHPYAFTNKSGRPETIKNFQRLYKNAINEIGLDSKKYLGTTEHGHRHSYGYRLAQYGLTQVEIQKAMHQKNPNSCLVYINPSNSEIRKKLEATEYQ